MRRLLALFVVLPLVAACSSDRPASQGLDPKAPISDSGPHIEPILSLTSPTPYSDALASSMVNKQWTVAARYTATDPQDDLYNRIAELGGYAQYGGMGIELSNDSSHLDGIVSCVFWDDGVLNAQQVVKISSTTPAYGSHTVACSYDGAIGYLYLDGVLQNQATVAYTLPSGDMGVGQASSGTHALVGSLAWLSVWDRTLSASEVGAL